MGIHSVISLAKSSKWFFHIKFSNEKYFNNSLDSLFSDLLIRVNLFGQNSNRSLIPKMTFSFLRIWSHLLKKSLMEYLIFCAVDDLFVQSLLILLLMSAMLKLSNSLLLSMLPKTKGNFQSIIICILHVKVKDVLDDIIVLSFFRNQVILINYVCYKCYKSFKMFEYACYMSHKSLKKWRATPSLFKYNSDSAVLINLVWAQY